MSLSRDLEAALFVVSFTYSFVGSGSFLDFVVGLCFHVFFRICFHMHLLNRILNIQLNFIQVGVHYLYKKQ